MDKDVAPASSEGRGAKALLCQAAGGGVGRAVSVWRRFHEERGVELIKRLNSQAADGDGRDSTPPLDRHRGPLMQLLLSTGQILLYVVHL